MSFFAHAESDDCQRAKGFDAYAWRRDVAFEPRDTPCCFGSGVRHNLV